MQVTGTGTTTSSKESMTFSNQQVMGKDDFLRLLTTQLSYQDPINPVKNEDFVAQLAQFTSLEQMQNMGESITEFVTTQTRISSLGQASSLMGKEVDIVTSESIVTGKVSGLRITATGMPLLVVDGNNYSLNDVVAVRS